MNCWRVWRARKLRLRAWPYPMMIEECQLILSSLISTSQLFQTTSKRVTLASLYNLTSRAPCGVANVTHLNTTRIDARGIRHLLGAVNRAMIRPPTNPTTCCKCKGKHFAYSKDCPKWMMIPFPGARKLVESITTSGKCKPISPGHLAQHTLKFYHLTPNQHNFSNSNQSLNNRIINANF